MAVPYAGYVRTKSRQQAQDERRWGQDRFDGGQDSDTPPVKIATNELALAVNTVCYPDRIEGGYGRILGSDERLPGSGPKHDLKQHSVTGRWLLHRGDKLWLSAGRRQREWSEVTPIGPDGSLEATGEFNNGSYTVSGGAAAYLSNMVISGAPYGQTLDIQLSTLSGPSLNVAIYLGATLVCGGSILVGDQPGQVVLSEEAGSGISGTVDVAGWTTGTDTGTATPGTDSVTFSLRGLTLENTDSYTLYWTLEVTDGGTNAKIRFYKDAALTTMVAETGTFLVSVEATILITPASGYALSGDFTWQPITISDGLYGAEPLEFDVENDSIDASSDIDSFKVFGFVPHVRNSHMLFVDQRIKKYWMLATAAGYGQYPIATSASGDFAYRYLYTLSRITNLETGVPVYSGSRLTASLDFEGPSNITGASSLGVDYGTIRNSAAVSSGNANTVTLRQEDANGAPLNNTAASYITHISIYRTLDVGVNGLANNPEIYIWVADVPIYSTSYEDTTSDTVLQNRFSGGALSGENFALRSRFFREMDKGIGAIRPDFMATATPQGTKITYCDVGVNPRFVGYYFPGSQYNLTQDPISDIVATKDLFVYACPYSTYTSIAAIAVDTGVQGVSYIPVIQNFERSSQSVGVKYGQRTFPVTDSSFVSLCSDGTIRVYSGTFWGEPLDGNQVHKLIELAQIGAVLLYFRDALYVWYTTDPDATVTDKCLRYGAGGQSGNGWTPVYRAKWVWPPVGGGMSAVWEQDDATLRMLAIDDAEDVAFAVEDLPPLRQYEDDLVEDGYSVQGAGEDSLANLNFPGWEEATLYGIIRAVDGGVVVQFFESDADRTANVNAVGMTDTLTEPADGVTIMGVIPGTVDVLSVTPVEFMVVPGVRVSGKSQITSPMRIRALAATQQQFICFHQESYAFFRAVYGMPMPTVAARWYADEVLVPTSVQSAVPPDGDIQSYAQVKGRTIQFELEPQSSGWQLTGINTKYQTQDMRSANGPWNSVEQLLQRELAQGLFSWVLGVSGLINRADGFYPRYSGPVPTLIPGPFGRIGGQQFTESSSLTVSRQITTYSLLFWVKEPVVGIDAAPFAMLDAQGEPAVYMFFPDATHVSIGSFEYEVAETSEWVCYCVTRSENGFKTYRDGVLIGDNMLSPGTDAAVVTLRIGAQMLYDIRVYSSVLSSDAVAYYYNHLNQTPP